MGLLDDVVSGAASDAVTTPDLLRQVHALAQHLDSAELRSWARAELSGYLPEHRLPMYRGPFTLPVGDVGEVLELELRGPLTEVSQIADLAGRRGVDDEAEAANVARYRDRVGAGIEPRIALMRLCSESRVVPAPLLRSVDESVRNRILELALDLRAVAQQTADGLTVSAAALAFIMDGALGFGLAGAAVDVAEDGADGTDAAALRDQLTAVLADAFRADEAVQVVLVDETSAAKRNSVQRLAHAVRAGRIPAAPGIPADEAADRVVDIAARHLGW